MLLDKTIYQIYTELIVLSDQECVKKIVSLDINVFNGLLYYRITTPICTMRDKTLFNRLCSRFWDQHRNTDSLYVYIMSWYNERVNKFIQNL